MKIFIGYGYNKRDGWIETHVFPILECMGFTLQHGKDMHGAALADGVKDRIEQCDAAIGFFTIRDDAAGDFTSHIWVRDEMVYAFAKGKPVIPVREEQVKVPDGILGNVEYITLRQNDRLSCVTQVVRALGQRHMRRLKLEPQDSNLTKNLNKWRMDQNFKIRYRTQDYGSGYESQFKLGRLERFEEGFYVNVTDVPRRAYVEVEGVLNGEPKFNSGWASADAVSIKI